LSESESSHGHENTVRAGQNRMQSGGQIIERVAESHTAIGFVFWRRG
jgi:hypothetical protein